MNAAQLQQRLADLAGVPVDAIAPLHDDQLCTSLAFDLFAEEAEGENGEIAKVPKTIPVLPNKRHVKTRDGREFINEDPQALIDSVRAGGIDLVIGADHDEVGSIFQAAPAPARGWIDHREGLRRKGKYGIVGDVQWTDLGREGVERREFRYVSPVLDIPGMFDFVWGDGPVPTIAGIIAASIVNIPALRMPALNSRRRTLVRGSNMDETIRKQLCAALGLPDDAKLETILAAAEGKSLTVEAVEGNAAAAIDLTQWVPREEFDALAKRLSTVEATAADTRIDQAIAKNRARIASPAYEKVLREQLSSGALTFEAFEKLMEATPESRLTKEDEVGDPEKDVDISALGLSELELEFCKENKVDPADFAARRDRRRKRHLERVI